jgi:hypothetical protein
MHRMYRHMPAMDEKVWVMQRPASIPVYRRRNSSNLAFFPLLVLSILAGCFGVL